MSDYFTNQVGLSRYFTSKTTVSSKLDEQAHDVRKSYFSEEAKMKDYSKSEAKVVIKRYAIKRD